MVYSAFYNKSGEEIPIIYPKMTKIQQADAGKVIEELLKLNSKKIERQQVTRPPPKNVNKKIAEQKKKIGENRKNYKKIIEDFNKSLDKYFNDGKPVMQFDDELKKNLDLTELLKGAVITKKKDMYKS